MHILKGAFAKPALSLALLLMVVAKVMAANAMTHGDAEDEIRRSAELLMREHRIPGIAIAISNKGQRSFYNFGVASKATGMPVTSDTIFEIGSISKTFTATLTTYAATTGRLSLTDSPARFFPELQGSDIAKVNLLNLGTHTAGGFPLQLPDEVTTHDRLMAYYKAWRPQYPAGTARSYANPSIALLGMVSAKAMNMSYSDAIQKRLLPAMDLKDTYLTVPKSAMPRYAQGYNKIDAPVRVNPGVVADEAYGVKTSARDLIRFLELNMNPKGLSPQMATAISNTHVGYFKLGAMTQDLVWEQYEESASLDEILEGNSAKISYETNPVAPVAPMASALNPNDAGFFNKTGSTNGFGAYVAFRPSSQIGIAILANKNFPIEARIRLAYRILGSLRP